jgi:SAM-dependent methyltransferase
MDTEPVIPESVARLTLVLFLPDGRCALPLDADGRPRLPSDALQPGEDWLFDASLRIPLMQAGFRRQRTHAVRVEGDHVLAWCEGDRYHGARPHTTVELLAVPPEQAAALFEARGEAALAAAVREAARSYRGQTEESYYVDNVRLLEPSYLRAATPEGGSGFGRDAAAWRLHRRHIVDAIHRGGTFLDVGCANGLLMESVQRWAGERGLAIESYGLDLAPGLVELARRRLPWWAARIWVGNAINWRPPGEMRFDFVHTLLDAVPARRRADLLRHLLTEVAAPSGRLIVSHYVPRSGAAEPGAAEQLRRLGFVVDGETSPDPASGLAPSAWIDVPAG